MLCTTQSTTSQRGVPPKSFSRVTLGSLRTPLSTLDFLQMTHIRRKHGTMNSPQANPCGGFLSRGLSSSFFHVLDTPRSISSDSPRSPSGCALWSPPTEPLRSPSGVLFQGSLSEFLRSPKEVLVQAASRIPTAVFARFTLEEDEGRAVGDCLAAPLAWLSKA